jgi:hypothetical protein
MTLKELKSGDTFWTGKVGLKLTSNCGYEIAIDAFKHIVKDTDEISLRTEGGDTIFLNEKIIPFTTEFGAIKFFKKSVENILREKIEERIALLDKF